MNHAHLVGTWNLSEYLLLPPDEPARPLWENIRGQLVYTEDGTVSVVVVRMGVAELTNAEVIAYSGRYRLQDGLVTHEVAVSNLYRYIGKSLSRKVDFEDNRLILTTTELVKGAIHRITWAPCHDQSP